MAHVPQQQAVQCPPRVLGGLDFAHHEAVRRIEIERQLQRDKEKREDEARSAAFERESARLAAEAVRRQQADAKAAQEKERLEAPRRYASSLRDTGGAPVYYFDTNHEFQELGKERKRVPKADAVPMKRVRRVVDRWVYGPNTEHQLEEGESELVTKVVWVRVPM